MEIWDIDVKRCIYSIYYIYVLILATLLTTPDDTPHNWVAALWQVCTPRLDLSQIPLNNPDMLLVTLSRATTTLVSLSCLFMPHLFQVPTLPTVLHRQPNWLHWLNPLPLRTPTMCAHQQNIFFLGFSGCYPLPRAGVVAWSRYCCMGVVSHRPSSHFHVSRTMHTWVTTTSRFTARCQSLEPCSVNSVMKNIKCEGRQNQTEKTVL